MQPATLRCPKPSPNPSCTVLCWGCEGSPAGPTVRSNGVGDGGMVTGEGKTRGASRASGVRLREGGGVASIEPRGVNGDEAAAAAGTAGFDSSGATSTSFGLPLKKLKIDCDWPGDLAVAGLGVLALRGAIVHLHGRAAFDFRRKSTALRPRHHNKYDTRRESALATGACPYPLDVGSLRHVDFPTCALAAPSLRPRLTAVRPSPIQARAHCSPLFALPQMGEAPGTMEHISSKAWSHLRIAVNFKSQLLKSRTEQRAEQQRPFDVTGGFDTAASLAPHCLSLAPTPPLPTPAAHLAPASPQLNRPAALRPLQLAVPTSSSEAEVGEWSTQGVWEATPVVSARPRMPAREPARG
jgi:hypothetical protein